MKKSGKKSISAFLAACLLSGYAEFFVVSSERAIKPSVHFQVQKAIK
ncbi:MAG: hypothetical protein PHV66_04715 [Bacteroidales bacterium]|nr:hypothetical protein [Bacteroidales bacterium]